MNTAEALAQLGVDETVVTREQRETFEEVGYCIFPALFSATDLDEMRAEVERLQAIEGSYGGHEVHIEPGPMRLLSNLFNKSAAFDRCLRCAPTLTLAHHLLGEIRVYSLNARNPAKGHGQQLLHSDVPRAHADDWCLVNTMIMLDDMTEDNGPTRVGPGSHKLVPINVPDINMAEFDRLPMTREDESMIPGDPMAPNLARRHEQPQRHASTRTKSRDRTSRCAVLNEREHVTRALYDRAGPAERYLLDIEGAQPRDIDPLAIPRDARLWKAADVERN
jgi:hypothetical protein